MRLSPAMLFRGVGWIAGMFILSNVVRFGSNLYLTRILTPELMGAVLIIFTIRNVMDLLSDVGLGQNIVTSKHGDDPIFRSTAWVIQCLRGSALGFFMFISASYVAEIYAVPATALELASFALVVAGFSSTSLYVLQRRLRFAYISAFDAAIEILSSMIGIIGATISPTLWALVWASLIAAVVRFIATYFLPVERVSSFGFSRAYAKEIFHFGKWIFLMSILMLFCSNFDKLYLGQAIPIAVLGVYGIAKMLSEVPGLLVGRVCYSLVFPTIASISSKPRDEIRSELASSRRQLLMLAALAMGFGIAISDIVIEQLYDSRYHDAGTMLPILLAGVWFGILANINEYALLGLRRPAYGVAGNILKVAHLVLALPLALSTGGILLGIATIATADIPRLIPLAIGVARERLSFFGQDAAATLIVVFVALGLLLLRYLSGFGAGALDLLL